MADRFVSFIRRDYKWNFKIKPALSVPVAVILLFGSATVYLNTFHELPFLVSSRPSFRSYTTSRSLAKRNQSEDVELFLLSKFDNSLSKSGLPGNTESSLYPDYSTVQHENLGKASFSHIPITPEEKFNWLLESPTEGSESSWQIPDHLKEANLQPSKSSVYSGSSPFQDYFDKNTYINTESNVYKNAASGRLNPVDISLPYFTRLSLSQKRAKWKLFLPYRAEDVDIMARKPLPFLKTYKNPCWVEMTSRNYSNNYYAVRADIRQQMNEMEEVFYTRRRKGDFHRLRCLPYFLVIGQPKCGSTDLYRKIIAHPEVCNLPPKFKEPHWWARGRFGRSSRGRVIPFDSYVDLFDHVAYRIETENGEDDLSNSFHHMVTGEGSMSTFWDNDQWWAMVGNENLTEPRFVNPDYIHHLLPDTKLILILRNPTTRMYSDYLFFRKERKSALDFHDSVVRAIQVYADCSKVHTVRACVYNATISHRAKIRLRIGMYAVFLTDWLRVFPRRQLFIVRTEDYAQDPRTVMRRLYSFLGLRELTLDEEETVLSLMKANTRRKQDLELGDMLQDTRSLLDKFYAPFNQELVQILDDDSFLWENDLS